MNLLITFFTFIFQIQLILTSSKDNRSMNTIQLFGVKMQPGLPPGKKTLAEVRESKCKGQQDFQRRKAEYIASQSKQ